MGLLEGILIGIGVIFIVVSFFVTEKLSKKEIEEISKLSENELKIMVEKKLFEAESKIDETMDTTVDNTLAKVERSIEKESNEKIMAINEYSDTVLESINKTHNEVMFLYSMLNDRYDELTKYATELTGLKTEMEGISNKAKEYIDTTSFNEKKLDDVLNEATKNTPLTSQYSFDDVECENHNEVILNAYNDGMSEVDIAKKYGLGIGEVRLVLDLYKGDSKSEV